MGLALLLVRVLLVAVFVIAALAKLADLRGTRETLRALGCPPAAVRAASVLLPVSEFVIALLLVRARTAWLGGIGAAVLLLLFTGVAGWNLACGEQPACQCFGQISAAPIGPPTLVRNLLLLAAAGLLVLSGRHHPGFDVLGWLGGGAMLA